MLQINAIPVIGGQIHWQVYEDKSKQSGDVIIIQFRLGDTVDLPVGLDKRQQNQKIDVLRNLIVQNGINWLQPGNDVWTIDLQMFAATFESLAAMSDWLQGSIKLVPEIGFGKQDLARATTYETRIRFYLQREEVEAERIRSAAALKKKAILETAFHTYQIQRILGEGGTGRVYEVIDESGEIYAIKSLRSKLPEAARKRFANEIVFSQKNTHPNVITISDHGMVAADGEQSPFYVMRRYSSTLRGLMKDGIPHDWVRPYFLQILDGIGTAHTQRVWHRDLKPENILYDSSSDTLVIADFGIADFTQEELYTLIETKPGDRLANFVYAAPEQRVRGCEVDHRADIYALGLILNEMFTGKVPQGAHYPLISNVSAEYAYLDDLVEVMIANEPDDRIQSIEEVKARLF